MKNLFLILAVTSSLVSCTKSSPAPSGCTVSTGNIAGKYVITAISYKSSSSAAAADVFTSLNDCQKDDSYSLNADGTVTISEESNDCGLPPMPGAPTSWYLDKNNSVLVLGDNFNIESFDCKKLVLTQSNVLADGDSKTITYSKQ